jgi:hypothetical protein
LPFQAPRGNDLVRYREAATLGMEDSRRSIRDYRVKRERTIDSSISGGELWVF